MLWRNAPKHHWSTANNVWSFPPPSHSDEKGASTHQNLAAPRSTAYEDHGTTMNRCPVIKHQGW